MKKVCSILILLTLLFSEFNAQTISFGSSDLQNATIAYPTSLQFGPDGRLYVSQVDGTIKVFTVVRDGKNSYRVTGTETILLIKQIPNHNDDGTLNTTVNKRQVTGILVTGTSQNPIIYVTSSDPRVGAGLQGGDLNLDTNSGIISKLTWNGTAWVKVDLVRGLPRSEENHSLNGMDLDQSTNTLYVGVGGHTNMGALSANLAYLPEFAYSAAVIKVDLNAIGNTTYDMPTLDDEDRPGVNDQNDPFGGNNGKNQAVLVPGGPVQVFSSGFRNPYDVLIAKSGRIYTFDNGPNAGWGGTPIDCADDTVEGGKSYADGLHLLSNGYYGGHPNTTRANRQNIFNNSNPQSPIPQGMEDPRQCTYLIPGVEDLALTTINSSTNGLAEYTASNFNNAMKGNLITAVFDGAIYRIVLNNEGTAVVDNGKIELFSNFGTRPLDVITRSDNETFPGSIWVANLISGTITVFEPNDNSTCDTSDPNGDADQDGYTNSDELANGTDPCNPSNIPGDWDKDKISDLNDPDDDNDNVNDITDAFALDKNNGTTSNIPVIHTWNNDSPEQGGILNLGFTGLMINGKDNYRNLYDPGKMTAGGAAGVLTIDDITSGDAFGNLNSQEYAFQFGVNTDAFNKPFIVHTRINAPFAGFTPKNSQSMGIFLGTGDQDNYLKIAATANDGLGGIEIVMEQNGVPVSQQFGPGEGVSILNKTYLDFFMLVNPGNNTVQCSYSVNAGAEIPLGGPQQIPGNWLTSSTAVGIIATSRGAEPLPVTWDMIEVVPQSTNSSAVFSIIPPFSNSNSLTQSTYHPHSFRILNSSPDGQNITKITVDLSTAIMPDIVFDPSGKAGDIVGKKFTPDSNAAVVGFASSSHFGNNGEGFEGLEVTFNDFNPGELFTFSIDVDPTSIKGSQPGGPRSSGSVSGIELIGSTVRIDFSDGSAQTGQLYRIPGSKGASQNTIKSSETIVPTIAVEGISENPFSVTNASQIIKITGTPNSKVKILKLEGGLFRANVPGGGFDIDPFEANSVIVINEDSTTTGGDGTVTIPITLTRTDPDSGGLNYIAAVIQEEGGRTSSLSNILVLELRSSATAAIRINSGSNSNVTFGDITFLSDRYFTGTKLYENNNITDIAGTDFDELYRTERSSDNVLGSFSYNIPVASGNYSIWLHFAEIWFGATGGSGTAGSPGDRVFSVSIEGTPVLIDYDIIAEVGTMTAVKKLYHAFVGDGELNIDFSATSNRPKISAIEVLSPGDIPLLVELSSFTASAEARKVDLHWSTKSEVNNSGFDIERGSSSDNFNKIIDWNKIGFVEGAMNSAKPVFYSFTDNVFSDKGKYRYRLKQINLDGSFNYSNEIEVTIDSDLTFELKQNFPNPFNPSTVINLVIPQAGKVRLSVFNLLGEEVALLLDEYKEAGNYDVEFNAAGLNSGIYFYKMEAKGFNSMRKMILMK